MSSTLTRPAVGEVDLGEVLPPPLAPYLSGPSPWRRRDGVVAGVVAVVGLAGASLCFLGAADELRWRNQLDWVTAAGLFTGLFVLAVVGWIVVGMRRLRRGFRILAERKDAVLGLDDLPANEKEDGDFTELVRVPPMGRVHRRTCLLLRGKSPVVVPPHQVDSFDRCGVCRS